MDHFSCLCIGFGGGGILTKISPTLLGQSQIQKIYRPWMQIPLNLSIMIIPSHSQQFGMKSDHLSYLRLGISTNFQAVLPQICPISHLGRL